MDKNISVCLMVDYQYLYRLHKVDLCNPKTIWDFILKLTEGASKFIVNPSAKMAKSKLFTRLTSESSFVLNQLHFFHNSSANHVRKAWEDTKFTMHKMEIDCWDCSGCGNKNFANQEADKRTIATMSEIILEGIYNAPQIDLFILVGINTDYEEIAKLCTKHNGIMFIAGFKEDSHIVNRELYTEFIDITLLAQSFIVKDVVNIPKDLPIAMAVSIPESVPVATFIQALGRIGLAPNKHYDSKDKHYPNHIFLRMFYSSREVANKAKIYVNHFNEYRLKTGE